MIRKDVEVQLNTSLQSGLKRHYLIMDGLAKLLDDEKRVLRFARLIDELVAAVVVETLERCDTEKERLKEISKVRSAFEARWLAVPVDENAES
jgi:hypothetical protein